MLEELRDVSSKLDLHAVQDNVFCHRTYLLAVKQHGLIHWQSAYLTVANVQNGSVQKACGCVPAATRHSCSVLVARKQRASNQTRGYLVSV